MKRVASFAPTEKPCQLMIAPGLLVMLSVLPCCAMTTPLATLAPIGLAYTGLAMTKQDATATAATLHCQVLQWWVFFILTPCIFSTNERQATPVHGKIQSPKTKTSKPCRHAKYCCPSGAHPSHPALAPDRHAR